MYPLPKPSKQSALFRRGLFYDVWSTGVDPFVEEALEVVEIIKFENIITKNTRNYSPVPSLLAQYASMTFMHNLWHEGALRLSNGSTYAQTTSENNQPFEAIGSSIDSSWGGRVS